MIFSQRLTHYQQDLGYITYKRQADLSDAFSPR
ncbi:hypothetical protein THF1C08_330055 [Vibrio jasicida]|uniref:Uncharacterized protein n=1 Tax=Vibrio jasicida TaxID=766224 RepID=A0AAU9QQF1_9VIBR|nr:hypothetical protein THF1C08_330055 [Vibrio jasicida]CAH1597756.1 hypothetical protein THF1A12_330057 [Vibrio jasicida]